MDGTKREDVNIASFEFGGLATRNAVEDVFISTPEMK